MHVFRLIVSVARRHWSYLAIYLGVLTTAAVCMGVWTGNDTPATADGEFAEERPKVAVIDRDGSDVSDALASYALSLGTPVEVEDSEFGLQDASARDAASYVLVIPEGYGKDLLNSAQAGEQAPALESVVSYQGARGALVDEHVRAWTGAFYAFAAGTDADAEQLIAWTSETCSAQTPVDYVYEEQSRLSEGYLMYATFSEYAIFCAVTVFIAVGMAPVARTDMRRRLSSAPVRTLSFGLQSSLACIVFGVVVWVFEAGVGLIAFGGQLTGSPLELIAAVVAAQFVYMLFAVAVGFLLWRMRVGEEYANAIGNVFGMLFSFMGGAWMPLELMSEGFQTIARLTPGFWTIDAMRAAANASSMSGEVIARIAGDLGITLLFALAVLVIGLAAGKAYQRDRDGIVRCSANAGSPPRRKRFE